VHIVIPKKMVMIPKTSGFFKENLKQALKVSYFKVILLLHVLWPPDASARPGPPLAMPTLGQTHPWPATLTAAPPHTPKRWR